jgi:hypothetical protein
LLNQQTQNPSAMSDGAKANIGIATKVGGLTTYNTGSGAAATHRENSTKVQLRAPTGLVKVAGFEVTPEVAQTLTEAAPEMFEDPSVKAAEEAKVADAARSEEITREDLNRHPGEIEGYHQHIVGEVSQQHLISLMVYGQRGEAPPTDLLNNIARDMGEDLGTAIDKVNLVSQGVQAQFTVLSRSMGLDADRAADWIKDHRKDTAMAAAQAHFIRRDLKAWEPPLKDYQAATGDGRKH